MLCSYGDEETEAVWPGFDPVLDGAAGVEGQEKRVKTS